MSRTVITVQEDADISCIDLSEMATDCHFVHRKGGAVDILRANRMVDIFDLYYDLSIPITKIEVAG
jgi:hypothetical protein